MSPFIWYYSTGGATPAILKPLDKILMKIWSKIGQYRMHTLNRLKKFGIMKFNDELKLQEIKFVWKWQKNKTPESLKQLITEKNDNLRGRRFIINIGNGRLVVYHTD